MRPHSARGSSHPTGSPIVLGQSHISCRWGDAKPTAHRCPSEIAIPGDEGRLRAEGEGTRKMDGVVATKAKLLGELTGVPSELAVDPDHHQLALKRFEVRDCPAIVGGAQAISARCARKRGPSLRQDKDIRGHRMPDGPQLGRQLGVRLGYDELDEGRGIEVEDQRRWSATRSETEPRGFTRGALVLRGTLGSVTRPRRTSAFRDSSLSRAQRRATGLPRRVTTISAPRST